MNSHSRLVLANFSAILLVLLIVSIVSAHQIYLVLNQGSDYSAHLQFWQYTRETGRLVVPHILFPLIAYSVAALMHVPEVSGGLIVGTLAHVLTAVVVQLHLKTILPKTPFFSLLAGGLAVCLSIACPIYLFALPDVHYGYVSATVWHNPTLTVSKPFMLPLFWLVTYSLYGKAKATLNGILVSIILATVIIFAKPSYSLVLLPATVLIALFRVIQRQKISWTSLSLGFILPSVIMLTVQFIMVYDSPETSGSIIFSPFAFVNMRLESQSFAALSALVASIAFPGTVYLLYFHATKADLHLNLAWLSLLIGLGQYYLLLETGARAADGNWVWGAHAAMFVLYVATITFLLRHYSARGLWANGLRNVRIQEWLTLTLFTLSVVYGMLQIGYPLP